MCRLAKLTRKVESSKPFGKIRNLTTLGQWSKTLVTFHYTNWLVKILVTTRGFGHCSLNNKSIHWFNQLQIEGARSHLRQELLSENRWYNSPAHKPPTQNQTANAKTTPRTKNHNQPTPKETCTCITWETLFWRETLHFLKVPPSKLGEDGASIVWRRGDEQFNFHRVSFLSFGVGDHSYGTDCCMICVLLCAPCRIQK